MKDGFLKAAALSPSLRVADCNYNASQIVSQLQDAAARGVRLAVFPEFCLTGYTCGDLFLQRTLQQGALDALQTVLDASRELDVVALVGLPLLVRGKLYNCAAVLCGGRLLGLVPKTYLPNYGEFYEKRQFTPGSTEVEWVNVCGQDVPFGTSLLFRCRQMPSFVLGVEICEDLWSALPPSTFHTLAGASAPSFGVKRRSRFALLTTVMEESAMAAPATTGFSKVPVSGHKMPAAIGIPNAL